MEDDRSDATIIEASLREPQLFTKIFERHYDPIRRYAQQRAGLDSGEEIAARVFEIAFVERASFDLRYASARPWLFGIATNLVLKQARAVAVHLRAIERLPREGEPPTDVDELISRVDAYRLREGLAEALANLHPRDRETLLLVALADLSYEETASALRVPVGTVRSRLNRARRILRELLRDLAGMEEDER